MRKAADIRRLIQKISVVPGAEMDRRTLGDALRAHRERDGAQSDITLPNVWRIILKSKITRLAAAAVIIIVVGFGMKLLSNLRDVDDSDTGVAVVKTDENDGTRTGTSEELQLRQESEQIERMYAAADVDGLVRMLSDGQPASKVLAANYLGRIGDSTAIAALESLIAQPRDANDPFADAVEQIKSRLAQETLTTPPSEEDTGTDPPAARQTISDSPYNQFLFLRDDVEDGRTKSATVVLVALKEEGAEFKDVYTDPRLQFGWQPVAVARGRLYSFKGDDLVEIDLASGELGLLGARRGPYDYDWAGGLLYFAAELSNGYRLVAYDFAMGAWCDLMECPFRKEMSPYTHIAVSPDQTKIAFVEPVAEADEGFSKAQTMQVAPPPESSAPQSLVGSSWPRFRIVIADLATGRLVRLPSEFVYLPSTRETGGSLSVVGRGVEVSHSPPQLVWYDQRTVLVVRADMPAGDRPAGGIAAFDVLTGSIQDVMVLPGRDHHRSLFVERMYDERVHIILSGEDAEEDLIEGKYVIDLDNALLLEDETIGGHFRLEQRGKSRRLVHDGNELEHSEGVTLATVSPDGRRILWRTTEKREGWNLYDLCYADAADTRNVHTVVEDGRVLDAMIWVADSQLAPGEAPQPPSGWTRFTVSPQPKPEPREPKVDTRPQITDVLTMSLWTDKSAYKLHEPIELTVTITNETDQQASFKAPRDTSAFVLVIKSDRYSGRIGEFEQDQEFFPTDPVVIDAGQSIQYTKTIEAYELGKHTIEGSTRLGRGQWQGKLAAEPITFIVQESEDAELLLRAKFERLIEPCRGDQTGQRTYNWSRIRRLGPQAAKYLVAELEASDDTDFHRRMGEALVRWASPDTLGYLQEQLAGRMIDQQRVVFETLEAIYQRSDAKDEALELLLFALEHPNRSIRRDAAKCLSKIHEGRVSEAFEAAVNDDHEAVAECAARYLAAEEHLELAAWLALAAEKPNKARYIAARSIIRELEGKWQLNMGKAPSTNWEQLAGDPDQMAAFKDLVAAWQEWATENPRFCSRFFTRDGEP
ncbi:MAG TPA: hypothetical protein VMX13_15710 [Sedimentisphaerales bacterium]|nr:hypothetical protein [Sedimentisphaerales bacterium]